MLESVEWGEYRLGDFFYIESTPSFNKDALTPGNEYDYVTRTSQNQGILQSTGFVNEENLNDAGTWSLGLLQMDFFYRRRPWYAGQFVRKIIPKIALTDGGVSFFSTILNKQKEILLSVLVRDVDEVFRNTTFSLPSCNGEVDYEFMERFIAKLNAARLAKLNAYLTITGLKDYTLTPEEEQALQCFESNLIEWSEYKMGKLFRRRDTKKLFYKAKGLPKEPKGEYTLPCLTSSFLNQGLNYYAPRKNATILKDVISIPSNSDVYRAYYQSRDFTVLSDAYAIEWVYGNIKISHKQYLFLVSSINQITDLPIYSYKNKLGGWSVVKEKDISLPILNDEIDYALMETLVSAIQKLVIKDVVLYTDREIETTKQVIDKTPKRNPI
ncbi:restriction endonuclease subunit S [Tannerella forsythia]|uniref:Type I restriction endonuclease subunit R n=1 Tax=Tannerella forsythia TaxID=28112 RepID=A0A3P1XU51_TANFO|nr:restriction endonuclease subunit S [Tannerella forsythia]RRD62005.1 type I restriction endonuclease subunit R [Tannerella forsythia]